MKNEKKNYREIVEAVRVEFPKFDKSCCSHALNTEKTGVQLCPRAEELAAPWLQKGQKRDKHRDKGKYTRWEFSLRKDVSGAFNALMERRGYSTKQAFMEALVLELLGVTG